MLHLKVSLMAVFELKGAYVVISIVILKTLIITVLKNI